MVIVTTYQHDSSVFIYYMYLFMNVYLDFAIVGLKHIKQDRAQTPRSDYLP